ncbi:hypothetical protein EDB85DRAFT_1888659 [Lactarius pseudohatsudake]|nr:hypothetical protein EDB85DRAFT_1888659 [Lactarius pseudohatsudake]
MVVVVHDNAGWRQYGRQDRLRRETEMRQGTVRRYGGEETAGVVHRWREGNGSTYGVTTWYNGGEGFRGMRRGSVEASARDSDGTFAAEICTAGATMDIVDSGEWGGDEWVVKIRPHKPVQILNELCCVHQISENKKKKDK